MKKNNLLTLITVFALVLSSCSTDENLQEITQSSDLLKSFEIKKDATGAYSVNFDVSEKTKIDKYTDLEQNKREFHLSPSSITTERSLSEEILIEDNSLKVGFIDVNSRELVSVFDDNIALANKSNENVKLGSYSIKSNEDGTYDLDFTVKNNVEVSFVYNESISTYEIHLEKGKTGELDYTKTFEKEEGEPLKIDFVNHITDVMAKSSEAESSEVRKPKIIISEVD